MTTFLLILSAMLGTLTQANGFTSNINRCIEWIEVLSAFNQSALDKEFFAWQDQQEQARLDQIMDMPVTTDEVEFDWHGNYWELMHNEPNMTSELACELVHLQYAAALVNMDQPVEPTKLYNICDDDSWIEAQVANFETGSGSLLTVEEWKTTLDQPVEHVEETDDYHDPCDDDNYNHVANETVQASSSSDVNDWAAYQLEVSNKNWSNMLDFEEAQMEHALGEVLVQEKLDLLKFMIEWQQCHLVTCEVYANDSADWFEFCQDELREAHYNSNEGAMDIYNSLIVEDCTTTEEDWAFFHPNVDDLPPNPLWAEEDYDYEMNRKHIGC